MYYQGGLSGTNLKNKEVRKVVKLWQNVDTLKIHLYPNNQMSISHISTYNRNIDTIILEKQKSQSSKNNNLSFKEYQVKFKGEAFQVLPSTVRGFSVSIKNHDITIHLKKITSIADKNPFAKIEFRSSFLHRFGYLKAIQKVISFLKDSVIRNFTIKVSELHLHVDIQGYNFSILDFHRIKSRTRSNKLYDEGHNDSYYYQGRSFQGFLLGSGDYMMRVYNKTREIKKYPNKSFIEELWKTNKNYNPDEDVFRIEFQIRREKLKKTLINSQIIDGFEIVLNNINNLWGMCLRDFSLRDLSDEHCLEVLLGYKTLKNGKKIVLTTNTIRQRIKRSEVHPLWNLIKDFNGHLQTDVAETFTKPFKTDFIYVHNAYKAFLSTALSHFGTLRPEIVKDSFKKIEDYTLKKHKQTVLENVLSKKLDRFNKVTIIDETYEKLETQKEYFLNYVSEIFESTFDDNDCLSISFYQKLNKFLQKVS